MTLAYVQLVLALVLFTLLVVMCCMVFGKPKLPFFKKRRQRKALATVAEAEREVGLTAFVCDHGRVTHSMEPFFVLDGDGEMHVQLLCLSCAAYLARLNRLRRIPADLT